MIADIVATQSSRSPSEGPHANKVTSYYPVVKFSDSQGRSHQVKSSRAARSDHFKRGEEADVFYDAKDPSRAFIQDAWILWFSPGVILAGGLIWILFAGFILLMSKRFDAGLTEDKARFFSQLTARRQANPGKDPETR